MKATTIAVFGLTAAACVCAQPTIMPRGYAGIPRSLAHLEARKGHVHVNWGKVKDKLKKVDWYKVGETAADIGLKLLERRMNEDELFAREYMNDDFAIRDIADDYLEARDYLEQRDLDLE